MTASDDRPDPSVTSADDRYEVFIVKHGTRAALRSEVFLNYSLYGEPDGPIGMDYFFWVLRNDARTVVVDTGFSRHGGDSRGRTRLADVSELLGALGVDVASGPPVVLTHAHYDHAGNLGLFTTSPVVMAAQELDFWNSRHAARTLFHHSVDDADLAHLQKVRAEDRLELFDGSYTVAPGVELLRVGGHTPGQTVILVKTADGTVLLASDAVHYYEELERDMPFSSVADLVDMYAAFETVRSLLSSGDVRHLVTGHDPGTLDRFGAVEGALAGLVATIGAPGG
ncbi:MAG: N-acyl homoserine lactonase family protein [Acidimicrobiales bacterium]